MPGRLLWRATPRRQARPLPHGAEHFSVHPVLYQLELAVHAHIEIHAGRAVDGFDQVLLVHARLLQFDHLFVGKRWPAGFDPAGGLSALGLAWCVFADGSAFTSAGAAFATEVPSSRL